MSLKKAGIFTLCDSGDPDQIAQAWELMRSMDAIDQEYIFTALAVCAANRKQDKDHALLHLRVALNRYPRVRAALTDLQVMTLSELITSLPYLFSLLPFPPDNT